MKSNNALLSIRVIAMTMIFLCHAFYLSDTYAFIGQFFNVGVPIFFILSGYLHSLNRKPNNFLCWLRKKTVQLYIPYLIILLLLFIATFAVHGRITNIRLWVWNILPISGITEIYLPGWSHWWYITDIWVCYALTNIFHSIKTCANRKILIIIFLFAYPVLLIIFSLINSYPICTLCTAIISYALGFFLCEHLFEHKKLPWLLITTGILLRLIFHTFANDSQIYVLVLAPITHQILGLGIFLIIFNTVSKLKSESDFLNQLLHFGAGISYEFYLIHQIVLNYPLVPNLLIIHTWLGFFISLVLAIILSKVSKSILKHIIS